MVSDLYEEELVTEDDMEKMKGKQSCLSERLFCVQCTKPPKVVTRTADVLDKFGYNEEARKLRGWCYST